MESGLVSVEVTIDADANVDGKVKLTIPPDAWPQSAWNGLELEEEPIITLEAEDADRLQNLLQRRPSRKAKRDG